MSNSFLQEVERKRKAALNRIRQVPVSCLIWGPDVSTKLPTAKCRLLLKDKLSGLGHYACFSEDLYDPHIDVSNLLQQAAQAEAFDIIFSIPDSPGSLAEINQFARVPFIGSKIVAYVDSQWDDGFANKALVEIQSPSTCKIQPYNSCDLPNIIIEDSLSIVKRLQEYYYLNGRR